MQKRRPRTLSAAQQSYGAGKTAGEVGADLEKRFGVVETFVKLEEDFIVDKFEGAYASGMELGMGGGSWDIVWDPSITLEPRFRRSLTSRRFDGIIRGVPTRAAQRGISHLRKDPYASQASRPSFIDTSLYQRSFRAWTEK
jgi:hypothetical protein